MDKREKDLRTYHALVGAAGFLRIGFVKGHYAVTAKGHATTPGADDAVAFCVSGAIQRACHDLAPEIYGEIRPACRDKVVARISGKDAADLFHWNDDQFRTQEEAVDLVQGAADAMKADLFEDRDE